MVAVRTPKISATSRGLSSSSPGECSMRCRSSLVVAGTPGAAYACPRAPGAVRSSCRRWPVWWWSSEDPDRDDVDKQLDGPADLGGGADRLVPRPPPHEHLVPVGREDDQNNQEHKTNNDVDLD